jgi:hypothetical protein
LVVFSAGDVMGAAGQSVTVPIIAEVTGSLPLRVLLLNLTVQPVDGAPALTVPVQFAPAALGVPNYTSAHGPANYAAVWLMTQIVGLTGSNLLGTLTVTLPTNAPADAAYAVVFGQGISGSHNGINLIPQQLHNGLLTLGPRSGSTWTDGIPDAWRLRYFLSITNLLSHAQADADGDGVPNWAEFKAGTDPVDVRSKLQVLTQRATTGARRALTLRWPTVPNKRYVLEGAPSLLRTNWTTIATDIVGDGGEKQFTDPDPTTRGIQFFRVRVAE